MSSPSSDTSQTESPKPFTRERWVAEMSEESLLRSLTLRERKNKPGKFDWIGGAGAGESDLFASIGAGVTISILLIGTLIAYITEAEWTAWHVVPMVLLAGFTGVITVLVALGSFGERQEEYRNYKTMLARAKKDGLR